MTLATRLPFATEHFWAHDSVLYARAITDFDPASHQPQVPGYLYYVALLRGLTVLTADANRSMTLASALAAAAAVVLLYGFAARLYDETTARAAALLLLTSAAFWGYGAVAYPYTVLAALTVACAWLFWRVLATTRARTGRLLAASAAWGVAIGFRFDLLTFLAPLWIVTAASAGKGPAAVSAAIVVVWDEDTRVQGSEWRTRRLKHGARLRVADVTHARELRVTARGVVDLDAPRRSR